MTCCKMQTKLFKCASSVDYLFYRLAPENDYNKAKSDIHKKLMSLLVISVVLIGLQCCFARGYSKLYMLLVALVLTLIRIRCLQFIFFTDSVAVKLSVLNELVKKINECNEHAQRSTVISDFIDRNSLKTIQQLLSRLYVMKHIYRRLWKTSGVINECFGTSMLVIIAVFFINLTIDAYLCYFSIFGHLPYNIAFGMD